MINAMRNIMTQAVNVVNMKKKAITTHDTKRDQPNADGSEIRPTTFVSSRPVQ